MTIQNLYTQYLDGKITQQKFLYEARRDQNLTMISSTNSFDDVVKILKNKSIISEKAHKESTGKQEVEVIAKTIDMVNPYEYTRGMNFELDITHTPAGDAGISPEDIAKAQKKVLTNLTKNPQYYCDKMHGKGEVSEEWVEVTKKELEKIGKGKAAKGLMREGLKVGDTKKFGKETVVVTRIADDGRVYVRRKEDSATLGKMPEKWVKPKDLDEGAINSDYKYVYKVLKNEYPEIIGNWDIIKSFVDMHIDDIDITDKDSIVNEFENYLSVNPEILNVDNLEEHGEYFDRVSDMNISQSPLEEKRLRIYEKYAQKYNKTVDEVKCMVDEAIALKDKAGNIQYAKDSTEASNIEKNAKTKGITLTKTTV